MENPKIEMMPVAALVPYAANSRTHDENQVAQIAGSIREFGFTNPVLIDDQDGIIAGHGRVMAARKLGLDQVPAIRLAHLTDVQKRAYIIADNKLALNAGWDIDLLKIELEGLQLDDYDLALTGFDEDELATLLLPDSIEGLTDEDAVPDAPPTPVTVEGDVWLLGRHRVMCGDSTSLTQVEELLNGTRADMIFTDPPYNVGFNGRSGKFDVIKNDDLTDPAFGRFIEEVCQTIQAVDAQAYYVWCNWNFYGLLQERLPYKSCIVWAKNVFGMGQGYRHQHEFCLFNGKIDAVIKNESDLWEVKKDTNYVHPTQKPVALAVRAFGNHIKLLNILDLFGGSGSTIIAAEQTGRTAYVMELDPKYCDVMVKRWQEYTGQEAIHEASGDTYEALTR